VFSVFISGSFPLLDFKLFLFISTISGVVVVVVIVRLGRSQRGEFSSEINLEKFVAQRFSCSIIFFVLGIASNNFKTIF